MNPRIKKINGEWCVVHYAGNEPEYIEDGGWLAWVTAYNFCIMLNNRK